MKRETLQRQRLEMVLNPGSPVAFEIELPTDDPSVNGVSDIDPWSTEGAIEDIQGCIEGLTRQSKSLQNEKQIR